MIFRVDTRSGIDQKKEKQMSESTLNSARQVSIPDYLVALYAVEPNKLGTQALTQKVIEQTSLSMAFGSKHALDWVFYRDRATLDLAAKQLAEDEHLAAVTGNNLDDMDWLSQREKARLVADNLDLIKLNNAKLRGVAATEVIEIMNKAAAAGLNIAAIRAANGLIGERFDGVISSKRINNELAIYKLHRKHPHLFSVPPYFRDRTGELARLAQRAKERTKRIAEIRGGLRKEQGSKRKVSP
jgi:hypothetical protein